jgi:hypothetical protein
MRIAIALTLAVQIVCAQTPLTDQRIIELTKSGLRQDELARVIASAPSVNFDLTPSAEQQMMQAGVTEDTIKAMAARENGLMLQASVAPAVSPIASVPTDAANHSHRTRNWIIVGVSVLAAGGLAYAAYRLSNPNHCGNPVSYPHPNPTCSN